MKNFTKKELAWISRLQKVLDAQPDNIIGFCTGIDIDFYKGDELRTNPYDHTATAVSGLESGETVNTKNWEAGAY